MALPETVIMDGSYTEAEKFNWRFANGILRFFVNYPKRKWYEIARRNKPSVWYAFVFNYANPTEKEKQLKGTWNVIFPDSMLTSIRAYADAFAFNMNILLDATNKFLDAYHSKWNEGEQNFFTQEVTYMTKVGCQNLKESFIKTANDRFAHGTHGMCMEELDIGFIGSLED